MLDWPSFTVAPSPHPLRKTQSRLRSAFLPHLHVRRFESESVYTLHPRILPAYIRLSIRGLVTGAKFRHELPARKSLVADGGAKNSADYYTLVCITNTNVSPAPQNASPMPGATCPHGQPGIFRIYFAGTHGLVRKYYATVLSVSSLSLLS